MYRCTDVTQGSNLHLLLWQADSLPLSHLGSSTYWLLLGALKNAAAGVLLPVVLNRMVREVIWALGFFRAPQSLRITEPSGNHSGPLASVGKRLY